MGFFDGLKKGVGNLNVSWAAENVLQVQGLIEATVAKGKEPTEGEMNTYKSRVSLLAQAVASARQGGRGWLEIQSVLHRTIILHMEKHPMSQTQWDHFQQLILLSAQHASNDEGAALLASAHTSWNDFRSNAEARLKL